MDKEQLKNEAIEWLCQLISTPRVSREEKDAADLFCDIMTSHCGPVQRSGNNLWTISPDYRSDRPTLLLNAHIDTVKPSASWTRNPFEPVREEGRIYGLGSNDDGASLVSLLQAFRVLSGMNLPYNLIFLASAEEEVSGANGMASVLPQLPECSAAIVGEPTGMQPAIAERGLMVLDITAHGRSGHAARNEGDNAIYHAMDDMQWFRTHEWPKISPLLGPVKMTVTIVSAGTQHNVIPDECRFTVDVRTNECYTNEELYKMICREVKSEVHARSFRLNSSSIDLQHPLVQRAIALGGTPFGSPTLSDQSVLPFPSMKIGPGQSSRSHTADEYILEQEIEEAIEFYIRLIGKPD